MIAFTIFNLIMAIICLIAVGYLAFRTFCYYQGNEKIHFLVTRKTPFKLEDRSFNQVTLVAEVPYRNEGKQNGTIMDCFTRHLLPQEQYDRVHVESWLTDGYAPRHDGYWKACIVDNGKGGKVVVRVTLTGKTGNIRNDAQDFPNMHIDLMMQVVGRSDWHITKERITLTRDEVIRALEV